MSEDHDQARAAEDDERGRQYLRDGWPGATLRTRHILWEAIQGNMATSTEDPDLWLKNQRRRFGGHPEADTPIFDLIIPRWRELDAERLDAAWHERHGLRWPKSRGPALHLFDDEDRRRLRFALDAELERRASDWSAWLTKLRDRHAEGVLTDDQEAVLAEVMPGWLTNTAEHLDRARARKLRRRKPAPEVVPTLFSGEAKGAHGFTETQDYYFDLARRGVLAYAGRSASTWLSRMRAMEAQSDLTPDQVAALDAVIPEWRQEGVATLDRLTKRELRPGDQKHVDLALKGRLHEEGGRASASWLERLRVREAQGRLLPWEVRVFDRAMPEWRFRTPLSLDLERIKRRSRG